MASKTLKPPAKNNQKSRDARTLLMKWVCQYIEAPSTQGKTFLIVGTKPRTSKLVGGLQNINPSNAQLKGRYL